MANGYIFLTNGARIIGYVHEKKLTPILTSYHKKYQCEIQWKK